MGKHSVSDSNSSSSSSDDSSSSSSSSNSEKYRKEIKKIKKKLKKEERRKEKKLKKKLKNEKKRLKKELKKKRKIECDTKVVKKECPPEKSSNIPIKLMEASKAMAPMTKEEWEKRQSVVRRVLDEETGRYRLIKGDGEVLEEIVSYKQHKEINRKATAADGDFFQSQTVNKKIKK